MVYRDKLPQAKADIMKRPDESLELSLLTKSREWEYEEECRNLGRDGKIDPGFALVTEGDFLKRPPGEITAVIAGARANIGKVRDTMQKYAPGLPLKRAVVRPHEYRLDIVSSITLSSRSPSGVVYARTPSAWPPPLGSRSSSSGSATCARKIW